MLSNIQGVMIKKFNNVFDETNRLKNFQIFLFISYKFQSSLHT